MILLKTTGATSRRRGAVQRRSLRFDFSMVAAQDWLKDTVSLLFSIFDLKAGVTLALALALLASAVASVYSVHQTRERFVEMEQLMKEHEALESDWSRLVIEEGSWSSNAWIERSASEAYGLQIADPAQIKVVQ